MEDVQQVKIVAQWLRPFHREEKRDSTCDPGLLDFRKCLCRARGEASLPVPP